MYVHSMADREIQGCHQTHEPNYGLGLFLHSEVEYQYHALYCCVSSSSVEFDEYESTMSINRHIVTTEESTTWDPPEVFCRLHTVYGTNYVEARVSV